jgi:lipoyl(octanoyl) transferase
VKTTSLDKILPVEWQVSDGLVPYGDAVAAMEARVADIRAGKALELVWRFPVHATGRGGQYTYHGPGQRVVYLMLDLERRGRDLRAFVANLEGWVIDTLADFGVTGHRREGRVGVWVDREPGVDDKIAALGIRVRRWVTFHGISINLCPDLEHYSGIVACGIRAHGVTSLAALSVEVTMADLDAALRSNFEERFGPIVPNS